MPAAFERRLAVRTKGVTSSAIREILKVATRPDVTSFAGGLPAPELFPLDAIRVATNKVLTEHGATALQYGATDGVLALRQLLCESISDREAAAAEAAGLARPERLTPDMVMITTGSQQALDLIAKLLVDPGDLVGAENPSYLGGLQAFRLHQARFAPISMDEDGARAEAFDAPSVRDAKLLYLLPTFQNPTGRTMSVERRVAVSRVLAELGVPVVEDDPYGELYFDQPAGPTIRSLLPELTLAIGTFSKTLAPGLRLGWIAGPKTVIARLTQLKQSGDLHTSTLSQYVALEVLRSGEMASHLERLRQAYRERAEAMLSSLAASFSSDVRFTRPSGGMFVWVELPHGIDAAPLLPVAIEQEKVAFVPGAPFHPNGGGENTLRLNFTHASPDVIRSGIARLGRVLNRSLTTSLA